MEPSHKRIQTKPKPPGTDGYNNIVTTKIKFSLTEQQRAWLHKQHTFGIPVYAALGIKNEVLLTQNFYKKEFSVQEFEEKAVHIKEFVDIIVNICLHKST